MTPATPTADAPPADVPDARDRPAPAPARWTAVAALAVAAAVVWLVTWAAGRPTPTPPAVVADAAVAIRTLDVPASSGTLTEGDAERGGHFLDAYVYETDTEEPLVIRVAGAFAPSLAVHTPDGRLIVAPAAGPDPLVAEVRGLGGGGRYTITVSSRDRGVRGRYALSVDERPVPYELTLDGPGRPGELGARYRARPDGRYEDRHAFEARRGQPYLALLIADSLFARLVVRSPEGDSLPDVVYEQLRTARGTYASVARFTPRYEGRYVVSAVSSEPGGVGSYTLAVKSRTDPVTVSAGIVRGVLGLVSRVGPGGRYVDTFTFAGQAGQRMDVSVRANGFGATLAVYGPDGKPVGSGGTAYSVVLPMSGRYRAEVSSGRARQTGSYDLAVAPHATETAADSTGAK